MQQKNEKFQDSVQNKQKRNKPKGKIYVIHDCGNYAHSVAARSGEQLHDGRVNSLPAGGCHCHGAVQLDPGPPISVMGAKQERPVNYHMESLS